MHNYLLVVLFFFIASCSSLPKKPHFGSGQATLTEDYANYRFEQISDVDYDLSFDLSQKSSSYSGVAKAYFQVRHLKSDLRLDFHQGTISSLKVNNQVVPANYNGIYIILPAKNLKVGGNSVEVTYAHPYSTDGRGFHRFKDPEDGRIYTYTNLEPYKANRVFPCFDQPDLKATYTMQVTAPKSWTVITSVMESEVSSLSKQKEKTWMFPKSAKFSTYIWSLHAGEYASWSWKKGKYPLRLFARKSLAKYVKIQDWFPVTDQGFTFFEKYFGVDYPYKKYDQVIVPEFNSGAMENVAAITFSERYVSRGEKTHNKKRSLAQVILHEMAHMWFGNLVTMKWWNDLWLNESFATYTASLAISRATNFKEGAWHSFNRSKNWAYWEDQLPTTHPIEADVPDTMQALANFDGITYGKGAASLKLLHYNLGEDDFQKGLESYFKTYAEKNTTLADFVGSLEKASGKDLANWRQKWLQTASVNTITVDLECDKNKVKKLALVQSYDKAHPVLRPHSLQVALFNLDGHTPKLSSTHKVSFDQQSTVVDGAVGKTCPQIVFPNYSDYGYFKSNLNKESIASLVKVLPNVKDSFLRGMYLQTLWEMVRDGKLNVYTFADVYRRNLVRENNSLVFRQMNFMTENLLYYLPQQSEKQKKYHQNFVKDLEKTSWQRLRGTKAGSELQKVWFSFYVDIARTPDALKKINSLLIGKNLLRGFKIDQDRRWGLVYQLSRFNFPSVKSIIAAESKRDQSNSGKNMAMKSQAVIPNWNSKVEFLNKMTSKDSTLSYDQFRGVARSLFPQGQEEFRQKYKKDFFSQLLYLEKEMGSHFPKTFAKLGPDQCLFGSNRELESFLKSNSNLKPGTSKTLKVSIKEYERCRKVKEVAKQYSLEQTL